MKNFISFFTVSKETYDSIKDMVYRENEFLVRFFTSLGTFTFAALAVASVFLPRLEGRSFYYRLYAIGSFVFMFFSDKHAGQKFVCAFVMFILSFGIVMGTVAFPESATVSYFVLMFSVPLLFFTRACYLNTVVIASSAVYFILALFTQSISMLTYNMVSLIPYTALSLFLNAVIMKGKMTSIVDRQVKEQLLAQEKHDKAKLTEYETFIADMVRYTTSAEEPEKIMNQLVQYIGEKMHSDRAYIFEENENGTFDNTYEWCAEGVSSAKEILQNVPYENVIEVWYEQYEKEGSIRIANLEEYRQTSQRIYDILKPQGVQTLVSGPLIVKGKKIGFYGVDNPPEELIEDISELIQMMEFVVSFMLRMRNNVRNLEYTALHDQLTACKNRQAMEWIYRDEYDYNTSFGLFMADLNGLKVINDSLGHDAGDRFIKTSAAVMKKHFGKNNVYRIGGDEFIAVLTGITEEDFAETVRKTEEELGTSASVGSVFVPVMNRHFDDLLKEADHKMYEGKKAYYSSKNADRRDSAK